MSDTGKGISRKDFNSLFDECIQMNYGYINYGLMSAQEIINEHHGLIGCNSGGLGHGSTFYFDLPIESVYSRRDSSTNSSNEIYDRTGVPPARELKIMY